jgi:hypothetical protein
MKKLLCLGSVGVAILAIGVWLFVAGQGGAAQDAALKDGVLKVAATLKKGDSAAADKQATDLAKKVEDLADLMELFKTRAKGGIGVGSKAGVVVPDGIETKLVAMGRDAPASSTLKKESAALEEMGYVVAAMANITKKKPVAKAKTKEWNTWCEDMATAGLKLSAAAKSQGAADLKAAATKINASCNSCHSTYRK